jgi:hypothetical protein
MPAIKSRATQGQYQVYPLYILALAAQQAVAVDGAGRPEVLHYLLLMRPGRPRCLASDRAATEPRAVRRGNTSV